MKHKKTNILLGIAAAGYLSIVLANIGLNRMIEGNGNPEQAKGMAWGVKMAEAILVNATPENSSYLTLGAYAVDVSNKYSSDFICRTERSCETSLVQALSGVEEDT